MQKKRLRKSAPYYQSLSSKATDLPEVWATLGDRRITVNEPFGGGGAMGVGVGGWRVTLPYAAGLKDVYQSELAGFWCRNKFQKSQWLKTVPIPHVHFHIRHRLGRMFTEPSGTQAGGDAIATRASTTTKAQKGANIHCLLQLPPRSVSVTSLSCFIGSGKSHGTTPSKGVGKVQSHPMCRKRSGMFGNRPDEFH